MIEAHRPGVGQDLGQHVDILRVEFAHDQPFGLQDG